MAVRLRNLLLSKEGGIFLVLIMLQILAILFVDNYTNPDNIKLLLKATPSLGILALSATVLMISGEFDLSMGSTFALAPMISALCHGAGLNLWLCIMIALMIGASVGLANGLITVWTGMPSFIVTIATMMFWRGITLFIAGARWVKFKTEGIAQFLFTDTIGWLPLQFIWFAGITLILWFLLNRMRFGNWIFATGGNVKAAKAMGINTDFVKVTCFIIAGILAAVAGLFESLRVTSVGPMQGGQILIFTAIAAMVIGGTKIGGGVGTVLGTFIGAIIMFSIQNILMLMRVQAFLFQLLVGVILVSAAAGNLLIRKKANSLE